MHIVDSVMKTFAVLGLAICLVHTDTEIGVSGIEPYSSVTREENNLDVEYEVTPIVLDSGLYIPVSALKELAATAPQADTTYRSDHPERRMTSEEAAEWEVVYCQMGMNREELELIILVNSIRLANGIDPLTPDYTLALSSRLMSQLMDTAQASPRDWWHADPYYGSASRRASVFRPRTNNVRENIAYAMSPAGAFNSMMNSKSHRALLLNPEVTYVGAGVQGRIYTLNFR